MGELGLRIYFKGCKYDDGDAAAAGWGGDRFWSWELHGRHVVATATRWDSVEAATRFFGAYVTTLRHRLVVAALAQHQAPPGMRQVFAKATGEAHAVMRRHDGGVVRVERRNLDVDIIDGANDEDATALIEVLRKANRR